MTSLLPSIRHKHSHTYRRNRFMIKGSKAIISELHTELFVTHNCTCSINSGKLHCTVTIALPCFLPDSSFHLGVIQLMIVQLSKEGKQHLDPTNGVDGTVNGVSHCGFHIL